MLVEPAQLLLQRAFARRTVNLAQLMGIFDDVHNRLRQYSVTMHDPRQKLQTQPALLFGFGGSPEYHSGNGRGVQ